MFWHYISNSNECFVKVLSDSSIWTPNRSMCDKNYPISHLFFLIYKEQKSVPTLLQVSIKYDNEIKMSNSGIFYNMNLM